MIKAIKIFFLLFLIILFHQSCTKTSNKAKKRKQIQSSILSYFFSFKANENGENAARIFYISPSIKTGTNLNLDFVVEANSTNITLGKKKIILVHGWDFNDKDSTELDLSQQKTRIITDSWKNLIDSSTYDLIVLSKSYDIYGFDYLTSNGVDINGKRFRARMDALFGNESNNIVIVAHSMGGLISRFAIYENTKPAYVNRIITFGTPFHGSPWASPQFQVEKGVIGNLAAFLSGTTGGKDLAWDNFDGKISGATNTKLTNINAKIDRDYLFYSYYGSISSSGTRGIGGSNPGLYLACSFLGSNFEPSDCIVPSTSASFSGNTLAVTRDLGSYDHFDIKLLSSSMLTTFYNDLP